MHRSRKAGAPAIQETSAVKPAPVTALTCVLNDELKQEWEKYLQQTRRHVTTVETLMSALGVAPQDTPGRLVVRHIGGSLVAVMKLAKGTAPPEAAEIVACECVVHAETKDPSEGLYKMIVDQV